MANETVQSITSSLDNMKVESTFMHPLVKDKVDDCEAAEEGITTDSEDYLSEPLRYTFINIFTSIS